jgi:hypothetical protein
MGKDREVVAVQKFTSEMEAHVARLVLEAHDIPCAVMRDDAGGMIPSMQLIYPVRLMVRAEHADLARRLLTQDAATEPDADDHDVSDPSDDEASWNDDPDAGWSGR